MLKTALTSFIGRVILALFTLIVVPVLPTLIGFVNDVLGYDLTDAQVTSYAKNAALGVAALGATWLLNRGLFERAAVNAKAVIEAGKNSNVNNITTPREEHQPGEFKEPVLEGEGGTSSRSSEAQRAGFKAGGSGSRTDPTVPPGISREQGKE